MPHHARAATTIADLPDDLLAHCLSFLELQERQQAALTSRRFAAVACSPQLICFVDIDALHGLAAVRSLTAWLARHGRHVRQLDCTFPAQQGPDYLAATATCLTAAGLAGGVTQLRIAGRLPTTEWLVVMQSLRALRLTHCSAGPLRVSPAISRLTALERLVLAADTVEFPDPAHLPTSVTYLYLTEFAASGMPQEIAQLPRLARLSLESGDYAAASMAALTRLSGSLTRLDIESCPIPAALSALTGLEHLVVWSCYLADAAEGHSTELALDGALPNLRQLTCLVILTTGLRTPTTIGCLSRLQRCYLCPAFDSTSPVGPAAVPLPTGPWLNSLRWLGARLDCLVSSVDVLRHATALEFLEVCEADKRRIDWHSPATAAFFDWLGRHGSLQRLSFEDNYTTDPSVFDSRIFAAQLALLCRRRPSLLLRFTKPAGDFDDSMLNLVYDV